MSHSDLNVTATFSHEAPAKPPCRVLVGELKLVNHSAERVYFVVPFFLDEPLGEEIKKVEALEVFRTTKDGDLYLCVHRNPACYLFPVEPLKTIALRDWRFMTWSEQSVAEVLVVGNPVLNEKLPIREWMTQVGIPESTPEEDNALLLVSELAHPMRLNFGEQIAKFRIDLSPKKKPMQGNRA